MKKEGIFQRITYRFRRRKMRYQMKKQQKEQEQNGVKIPEKIKEFGGNIVDVKPKKEEDYCTVLGLRMGRKLVLWSLAIVALLSLGCIYLVMPVSGMADGIRTYRYNALPLKFTSGQVRILAESGYVAYEGNVSKGAVNGLGTLYREDGSVVYEGEFQNNKYDGEGKSYYSGNRLQYEGQFVNNEFQGKGTLYREDGTKEYEGEFAFGQKQGEGKLYDNGGHAVYQGSFVKDSIRYQELLGKPVTEVAEMYTGSRVVYENDQEYCVALEDIDSVYISEGDVNTLEQENSVQGVYVLSSYIVLDGKKYNTINDLKKKFKVISYEGNSSLTMADAVAVNEAAKKMDVLDGEVKMDTTPVFEDVFTVDSIDKSYEAYVYQFEDENIIYTFFAKEKRADFDFYLMEQK
jgi:hypothetical protein